MSKRGVRSQKTCPNIACWSNRTTTLILRTIFSFFFFFYQTTNTFIPFGTCCRADDIRHQSFCCVWWHPFDNTVETIIVISVPALKIIAQS